MTEFAWDDPHSDLVALSGGPRDHRWYFYGDWLATRRASRRLRCPLDRPDGASRCYAPTTTFAYQTTKSGTDLAARVWIYLPPSQWETWGSEYRTPEEPDDDAEVTRPARGRDIQTWQGTAV
ncbi:hypothetical protein KIPE111705_36965 [Kibdelosporangium persicum]|uniref:DUF427 domain-containing protein n=1 Tax=Kibdelosporangium persicum TaxID=2698649 RepID=A0ABX2F508_9PSEU|nr:hypothetical protein [Kibdelosporangium persicum]NRN65895.1 hypothetical protein [Kibdelosporangium persicum]